MLQRAHGNLERWLFGGNGGDLLTQRLRRLARYPYALLRDLAGGQLNLHAMGLVYATLLAIVPLLAFCFAVLRMFGAHRELEPLIFEFFRPMGAAAGEMTQRVMAYAESVRAGLVGSLGLALLIWTSISTLKKVEDSLNFVWHVEESRSFMRRLAEYLSLLVIGPLLVVTVIGLSQFTMHTHSAQLLVRLPVLGQLHAIGLQLAPFAVVSVLFTAVYALAPNTRVRWWPALAGGLAAGCLWAAIGSVFTTFVVFSARMTIVYAGLAIVVAALVWTYLGWLILLLGAQLSFYVQNPNYLRVGLRVPRLSSSETEQLSLGVMYLIGESHLNGTARWTISTLSSSLALPGIVVASCVRALEAAGLLVSTDDEALVPARELAMIRVVDVLSVARSHHAAMQGQALVVPPVVAALCAELEAGWRANCGERTLRDLLVTHPLS